MVILSVLSRYGLHTDAHFRSNQSPLRDFCHDCAEPITPETLHILYDCERYAALRLIPRSGGMAGGATTEVVDTFADARDRDILNLAEEMEQDMEADKRFFYQLGFGCCHRDFGCLSLDHNWDIFN